MIISPSAISFIPPEQIINEWEKDYKAMQEAMIYGDSKSFEQLINRMQELQERFRRIK